MDFVEEALVKKVDSKKLHHLISTLESEINGDISGKYSDDTVSGIQNVVLSLDINKEIFPDLNVISSNFIPRLEQNYDNSQIGNNSVYTANEINNIPPFQICQNETTPSTSFGNNNGENHETMAQKEVNKLLKDNDLPFFENQFKPLPTNTKSNSLLYYPPQETHNSSFQIPGTLHIYADFIPNNLARLNSCVNYLKNLLTWSIDNFCYDEVKSIIQEFVDDKINLTGFCKKFRERFHKGVYVNNALKNIHFVRAMLSQRKISIEGIRIPPDNLQYPSYYSGQIQTATNISVQATASTILQNSKSNIVNNQETKSSSGINIDDRVLQEQLSESNLMLQPLPNIIEDEQETIIESTIHKSPDVTEKSFLNMECLLQRIKSKLSTVGLKEPDKAVVEIISQVCEEKMTRLLIHLLLVTEHRLQLLNRTENCEGSSDPNAQLRFLENFEKSKNEKQGKIELLVESKTEVFNSKSSQIKGRKFRSVETNKQSYEDIIDMAFTLIRTKKKPTCDGKLTESNTWARSQYAPLKSRFKKASIQDLKNLCEVDLEFRSLKIAKLL